MSSKRELVLKGGTVATAAGENIGDVHIHGGRISGVGTNLKYAANAEIIDVSGKYVLPGIIDGHVHLREFDDSDREDFYTGTAAAAVGGVTTVFDMPNSSPRVLHPDDFKARRDRVLERAYVNIGLYVWACSANLDIFDEFSPLGPIGFKVFTAETGFGDADFKKYITTEPDVFYQILDRASDVGALTAVHSESQALIAHLESIAKAHMKPDMEALMFSRPTMVEDVAVFSEVAIAKHCNARLHICHVVGKGTVDFIRWAKSNYHAPLSCEVTPHNLLMTTEETIKAGSLGRFSPPVHGEEHKRALWEGLLDGTIDMIGSDHAPQLEERKREKNIWKAAPGSPLLDYWVPLILDRVADGDMPMSRFVESTSKRPAEVFGIYPRKGSMEIGADADIVVVDMQQTSKLDPLKFMSKAKYSPFEGWTMRGVPIMTFVNGGLVAKDGKIVGKPGCGSFVSPGGEISIPAMQPASS